MGMELPGTQTNPLDSRQVDMYVPVQVFIGLFNFTLIPFTIWLLSIGAEEIIKASVSIAVFVVSLPWIGLMASLKDLGEVLVEEGVTDENSNNLGTFYNWIIFVYKTYIESQELFELDFVRRHLQEIQFVIQFWFRPNMFDYLKFDDYTQEQVLNYGHEDILKYEFNFDNLAHRFSFYLMATPTIWLSTYLTGTLSSPFMLTTAFIYFIDPDFYYKDCNGISQVAQLGPATMMVKTWQIQQLFFNDYQFLDDSLEYLNLDDDKLWDIISQVFTYPVYQGWLLLIMVPWFFLSWILVGITDMFTYEKFEDYAEDHKLDLKCHTACSKTQIKDIDGRCIECKYFELPDPTGAKCEAIEQKDILKDMLDLYTNEPEWDVMPNDVTQKILNAWNSQRTGGGAITLGLLTIEDKEFVKTPIREIMRETVTYTPNYEDKQTKTMTEDTIENEYKTENTVTNEYGGITKHDQNYDLQINQGTITVKNVQVHRNLDEFYDFNILPTTQEGANELNLKTNENLKQPNYPICCFQGADNEETLENGDEILDKYVTGFIRLIKYQGAIMEDGLLIPTSMIQIYEGQVRQGHPEGFGRMIWYDGTKDEVRVYAGFFNTGYKAMAGYGAYYDDRGDNGLQVKYVGLYSNNQDWSDLQTYKDENGTSIPFKYFTEFKQQIA